MGSQNAELLEENSLRSCLIECLSQQLSELELLESMYPGPEDIVLVDDKIVNKIKEFLACKTDYTPPNLDLFIKLKIDNLKLEISVNLPNFYPKEEPDIYVRCNQFNRQQESVINRELTTFLKLNANEEVCLYTAVSWLQENANSDILETDNVSDVNIKIDSAHEVFLRLWIFSHHIYNKHKRTEIVSKAKHLNLTGFCLPGKPGVICIEGTSNECNEWWKEIKSMNWQKIMIRKTETFDLTQISEVKKFNTFEEIFFENPNHSHKHADMSMLAKYLESHNLGQAFKEFFGLG